MHGNSFAQCTGWPRSGEEVVFLCKFAQPCIGGEIPNDESSPYKIPVGESSVISVISNERGEHSRLVIVIPSSFTVKLACLLSLP